MASPSTGEPLMVLQEGGECPLNPLAKASTAIRVSTSVSASERIEGLTLTLTAVYLQSNRFQRRAASAGGDAAGRDGRGVSILL